jgi:hypothetical protein
MSILKIYADFNGLVDGCANPTRTGVVLDTFGSLRDLCNAGVALHVGLPLIAVDESDDVEDLQGHGTAQFDSTRRWWIVEFDEIGVRYVPAGERRSEKTFLCICCRQDLQPLIDAKTLLLTGACPSCRTPLLAALAPPNPV